jgi:hypothetical protein
MPLSLLSERLSVRFQQSQGHQRRDSACRQVMGLGCKARWKEGVFVAVEVVAVAVGIQVEVEVRIDADVVVSNEVVYRLQREEEKHPGGACRQ